MVILRNNKKKLQENIDLFNKQLREVNNIISTEKSKTMIIGYENIQENTTIESKKEKRLINLNT